MRYLIIGCGGCGSSAAEALREADDSAEITLVSHEPIRVLARPRLIEYAGGHIPLEELETKSAEWADEQKLDVRLECEVVGLDPDERRVRLADGETLDYDRLLVAIGIAPRPVPFAGADVEGVFNMHYEPEALRVREAAAEAERAVVVGGGLLGQDMTGSFATAGLEVTTLVRESHVGVPQFDPHSGEMLARELRGLGADVRLETEVDEVLSDGGRVTGVRTAGEEIPCDLLFVAIGAGVGAGWLRDAGIELGRRIVVDNRFATGVDGVWAAGSCAEIHTDGQVLMQASWANAMAQGQAAAKCMLGEGEPYGMPSSYITTVGETKFTLFGAPPQPDSDARWIRFTGGDSFGSLAADRGVVSGGVLIGRHKKQRQIKALQLRDEPVPGLADLPDETDRNIDEFIDEAIGDQ